MTFTWRKSKNQVFKGAKKHKKHNSKKMPYYKNFWAIWL